MIYQERIEFPRYYTKVIESRYQVFIVFNIEVLKCILFTVADAYCILRRGFYVDHKEVGGRVFWTCAVPASAAGLSDRIHSCSREAGKTGAF